MPQNGTSTKSTIYSSLQQWLQQTGIATHYLLLIYYDNRFIYNCLQPLMVCLSHSGTLKLLDKLAEDHDIKVQFWSNDFKKRLEVNFLT